MEQGDIQGLLFSGYARLPFARYFFLRFGRGDAKGFVGEILNRVSSAARDEREELRRLNVAFTASGLVALGISNEVLRAFPRELCEGMAHPERARRLGDLGPDSPSTWQWGGTRETRIDALVLAYAKTQEGLEIEADFVDAALDRHEIDSHSEEAYLPEDGRGHFGFADAKTNPRLCRLSLGRDKNPFDPRVPAGEFVLGYRNARGERTAGPLVPRKQSTRELPPLRDRGRTMDLGHNGSYVALRKLEQDVPGFLRFLAREGERAFPDDPEPDKRLAAAIVGRWQDGTSLVRCPGGAPRAPDPSNVFGYRDGDPRGLRCPLGAHVRRANPRDSLGADAAEGLRLNRSLRLLRRGRLYGPKYDVRVESTEPRGLFFLSLCASLAGQFELVQESLIENAKLHGLYGERDPLVGRPDPALSEVTGGEVFSIQAEPYALRVPIERFVRVRGGAYLFLPGLRALAYLAEP
jgi:deferrochelatase/peroxidase EfeB